MAKFSIARFNGNKSIVAAILLSLIVVTLAYGMLDILVFIKMKGAQNSLKTLEMKLTQARNKVSTPAGESIVLKGFGANDVSLVIDELVRHGKMEGVNFISMAPQAVEDKERFVVLPLDLEIECGYGALVSFFDSFDEFEKSVVVVKSFRVIPDKGDANKLSIRLALNIYLEK